MRLVQCNQIKPGMKLGFSLLNTNSLLTLNRGIILTDDFIAYLRDRGYASIYIDDMESEGIEPIKIVSRDVSLKAMKAVEALDIEKMLELAETIVDEIASLDIVRIDILDGGAFDEYLYHHSLRVAVGAVAVGKVMGLPREELIVLAQAGICHDIGTTRVPKEILYKFGVLSNEEYDAIKQHPVHSYDMLYPYKNISQEVRQAVMMHHENENGTGYPTGKDGDKIPLAARIIHVVDIFDALTSKRPYKNQYTNKDALEYLEGGKDILFNAEVVDAIKKVISAYPTGMEVILSNNMEGLVCDNSKDAARPVIRLNNTGEIFDLTLPENKDIYVTFCGSLNVISSREVEELNEARQKAKERLTTIVLVDDSTIFLRQTSVILRKEGYKLVCLESAVAALNYFRDNERPDLLISDIEMPMMDGVTMVSKIREMGYNSLPVIFLTGKCDRETVLKCRNVDAKDYLIKPVKPVYLLERVAIQLEKSNEEW